MCAFFDYVRESNTICNRQLFNVYSRCIVTAVALIAEGERGKRILERARAQSLVVAIAAFSQCTMASCCLSASKRCVLLHSPIFASENGAFNFAGARQFRALARAPRENKRRHRSGAYTRPSLWHRTLVDCHAAELRSGAPRRQRLPKNERALLTRPVGVDCRDGKIRCHRFKWQKFAHPPRHIAWRRRRAKCYR